MRGNGEMTVKVKVNEVKRGERRESSRVVAYWIVDNAVAPEQLLDVELVVFG